MCVYVYTRGGRFLSAFSGQIVFFVPSVGIGPSSTEKRLFSSYRKGQSPLCMEMLLCSIMRALRIYAYTQRLCYQGA